MPFSSATPGGLQMWYPLTSSTSICREFFSEIPILDLFQIQCSINGSWAFVLGASWDRRDWLALVVCLGMIWKKMHEYCVNIVFHVNFA